MGTEKMQNSVTNTLQALHNLKLLLIQTMEKDPNNNITAIVKSDKYKTLDGVKREPNNFTLQCIAVDVASKVQSLHSCYECDRRFKKKCNLKNHIKTVHLKTKDIQCQMCDYVTGTKLKLDKHIEKHHPNFSNYSDFEKSVFRKVNLGKHYFNFGNLE